MAEVTARQRAILMTVVERYIETGEPVSSGIISALVGSNISSATVRNEMVALADAGLLEQPHTSAGRVPTARAFKMFVDRLGEGARAQTLSAQSRGEIDARFADVAGTQAVLERTSHVLAVLSSGVGVAIAALPGGDLLEHVHFSRLALARVLAVVVTRGGVVRDRVLVLDQDLSLTELNTAANFLNENFRGWEIERIRAELRLRVESEQREYHRLLGAVEQLWAKTVPHRPGQSVYVEGVANLVGPMGGVDDRQRLREMLQALETKQRLVDLLNAYIDAKQESVRVVFELEEHAPEMAGLVLIAARTRLGGEAAEDGPMGTVAVLGPKRMQYEKTMNAVGYIAQVLERQGLGLRG